MRPPPTTVEYIATHAARDPQRLALREDRSELGYGQLHAMLQHCALELQRWGVREGDRVAVSGPGFGIQLLLLLAAEGLGAVTVSFQAEDDADADWLFTQVDWVISCLPQATPPGVRFRQLDPSFARGLAGPLPAAAPEWVVPELAAPQRIVRTSGSSGRAKFMLLRRESVEWRLRALLEIRWWETEPGTRLLLLAPLVVNACFLRACGCLRRGSAVLMGEGRDIAALAPTHVFGLPMQVERLLAQLPPGHVAPQPVRVGTVGGAVSPALRARVRSVFGADLANRYGSNEAGTICEEMDADGTGVIGAGIDLRIVDGAGRDVAAGESGMIALRTPALVAGYLDRPDETAAAFRAGWFFSGDVGALVGPRRLRLAGRHDDLVNIGGVKLPAPALEQKLRERPAIADAAVVAVNLQGGAATLGIALVLAEGSAAGEAEAQLREALRAHPRADARLLVVSALPRLPGGKTDRMALLRLFRQEA